ncbi:MAG TPA: hypothetical protein V6C58_11020 [Allocoleopsis sp.]
MNNTLIKLLGYETEELEGKLINSILPLAGIIFCHTHFFPILKLQGQLEAIYFSLRSKHGINIPILC